MTRFQKINSVLIGIAMLLASALILAMPAEGYILVILIIGLSMTVKGLQMIFYFLTMARHMVGGRMILYEGIIFLDFGLFSAAVMDTPKMYVIIYLTATLMFSGVVDVLRALEAKKLEGRAWKEKLLQGSVFILLPLISLLFADSTEVMVIAYVITMVYGAVLRIIAPFRKTAVPAIPE